MSDYRSKYRMTVLVAALTALGILGALAWALGLAAAFREAAPLSSRLLWLIGFSLLLCAEGISVLVLTGGLIALRRDALEDLGRPYAPKGPLEWHAGPVVGGIRKALRLLLRPIKGRRPGQLGLFPGEIVIVRELEEITETLDERGMHGGLPFMPEMAGWCGRQVRVLRRVDKVVDWIYGTGLRRMWDTVFLEGSRCDGSAHGRCQADCQLMWREAWLRRPDKREGRPVGKAETPKPHLEALSVSRQAVEASAEPRYVCQMTQWPRATTPLSSYDPRHYLRDFLSGNVRAGLFVAGMSIAVFNSVQGRCGGVRFPVCRPRPSQDSQPAALDLRPGELVRIKSKKEIESTLDARLRNRGLWFAPEMLRFCGGEHRVLARISHQIDERSGKMINMANPCIVLEGIADTGEYLRFVVFNERIYWREVWLERAPTPPVKTI